MKDLNFKTWLFSEMADFGFGQNYFSSKIKGGTETILGNGPFKPINSEEIMTELARMPSIGHNESVQKWDNVIEWGQGQGALQVTITPAGSMRAVTRRLTHDLKGDPQWICYDVFELSDNRLKGNETEVAYKVYENLENISKEMIPGPIKEFKGMERFARKVWNATKIQHPSYCLFPVYLRKQDENFYKLVYEFRGQGVAKQSPNSSRAEQYNIDLIYHEDTGLISCCGYDIVSTSSQRSWEIDIIDFKEWYSPSQDEKKIIKSITTAFLQY